MDLKPDFNLGTLGNFSLISVCGDGETLFYSNRSQGTAASASALLLPIDCHVGSPGVFIVLSMSPSESLLMRLSKMISSANYLERNINANGPSLN